MGGVPAVAIFNLEDNVVDDDDNGDDVAETSTQ